MKFIEKKDIENLIKSNILDDITQNNNEILNDLELVAIDEIDSYIGAKYNTKDTFNKTGDDRNRFFVNLITDILLYHLHSRLTPSSIPIIRQERYDKAISYLYEVGKGIITPNIPLNSLPFNVRSNESLFGTQAKTNDASY